MKLEDEIKDFLTTRRARISPEQAGVPMFLGTRRVPGLRREEVAHLAGVSVDYYNRLERGKTQGASREVLDAIARALQLDDTERQHLFDLVHTTRTRTTAPKKRTARSRVTSALQAVLDSITGPAFLQNERIDLVAANTLGWALYPAAAEAAPAPFSHPRFTFLDPRASDLITDWDSTARTTVALLRGAAGRNPYDDDLIALVGTLSTQSEHFRTLWAAHDVVRYRGGAKHFQHPTVGELEFGYQTFDVPTDPGLVLLVYTVEPDSPTAQAMTLLSSWIAPTADRPAERSATDQHR
ncbi:MULTISPECIES: helix-turn-helix transcriptional regulator [unclassified Rathayibacter]|uniref:helix-turn-helix transcriptional regulator n=1 Tax=unclassified Rathayibacter TaxID=2609250 RepID=UPI001FB3987F|nr:MULTISPECIES: helix-turn-helix transcriptional regulator [unclassified Rathayibacter]MCJ1674470.1 helix-turn-helix transcriptional regulator [Rathayibacter sp. VKM Ac-2929]MCJ1684751.1 helix-turn-helix transcriptional regulator [Rathayibacter sp. VKM Ac-2928]